MFEGAAGSCKEKSRCPVSILGSKRERGENFATHGTFPSCPRGRRIFCLKLFLIYGQACINEDVFAGKYLTSRLQIFAFLKNDPENRKPSP